MDLAALGFSIDSAPVLKAANDLDRFASSAEKAAAAGNKVTFGNSSGSIAKLVAEVQSANSKLTAIVGTLEKIAAADRAAAAANENLAQSFGVADAHVVAYTQHLATMAQAQQQANAHVVAYQNYLKAGGNAQADYNAHVVAYRDHLKQLPPALDQASKSAGALQANTGNIAAQFQDIGVTAAMGMNPLIIGLQQGTQLSAVFAQSGGTMRDVLVGAFRQIASAQALATIGLVALVAVVIQLAIAWANSGDEADKLAKRIESLKTASNGVSDAQTILGNVFDLTTGKMKAQTAAAINLARAQLNLMKATAQNNIAKASKDLDSSSALGFGGRLGAWLKGDQSLIEGSARVDALTRALKNNQITGSLAAKGFQQLYDAGQITQEMFLKASVAAANYGMEIENVKTAEQALSDMDRGKLSKVFMNETKARKTPKGPKTDAEKLTDIYGSAQADIAAEKARALAAANDATALETAKLEKQTALLNAVQQKGIPITDAIRTKVAALADEYAKAKIAADTGLAINAANDDIRKQSAALDDAAKYVGLYGDALARAKREAEAQAKFRDSLPKGEIVLMPNLTSGVSDQAEANARAQRIADLRKNAEDSAYAMKLEQGALGLTGAAALSYSYVMDQLNQRKRDSIAISPDELAAIEAAGKAYGEQRHALDRQAQAIADNREITRGFLSDLVSAAREGGNAFKSLADVAVNSLNRIIDKLADRSIDSLLDKLMPARGGGTASITAQGVAGRGTSVGLNALGGVYGAERFAKGGAFTNSIVTSPTLFRFANGSRFGEMGEAGPEAIMPLKRGANGSLGVVAHGGARSVQMGDAHFTIVLDGAVSEGRVVEIAKQAGQMAVTQVRRDFASIAAEYDQNGVVAA